MATDYKSYEEEINLSYTDKLYSLYLQGEWGMTTGYVTDPLWKVRVDKLIADWQLAYDCTGELCARSRQGTTTISVYPGYGGSPFPQIADPSSCCIPNRVGGSGINAVPQTVVINQESLSIVQYTVDGTGGPVSGTTTFTLASLKGKTVDIALYGLLTKDTDYSFDPLSGTITLLRGLLFNRGDVYTIFSY